MHAQASLTITSVSHVKYILLKIEPDQAVKNVEIGVIVRDANSSKEYFYFL